MRFLIASDLHGAPDSAAFLQSTAQKLQPDACILLGDLLYHGPRNPLANGYSPLDVVRILQEMPVPVMGIRGNCDGDVDLMVLPLHLPEQAWLYVDGLRILALHGHTLLQGPLKPTPPPDTVILSGHTHVPTAHSQDGLHWWNPGSITLPKRGYPRSYAVFEDGTFTVYDVDGNTLMHHTPAIPA